MHSQIRALKDGAVKALAGRDAGVAHMKLAPFSLPSSNRMLTLVYSILTLVYFVNAYGLKVPSSATAGSDITVQWARTGSELQTFYLSPCRQDGHRPGPVVRVNAGSKTSGSASIGFPSEGTWFVDIFAEASTSGSSLLVSNSLKVQPSPGYPTAPTGYPTAPTGYPTVPQDSPTYETAPPPSYTTRDPAPQDPAPAITTTNQNQGSSPTTASESPGTGTSSSTSGPAGETNNSQSESSKGNNFAPTAAGAAANASSGPSSSTSDAANSPPLPSTSGTEVPSDSKKLNVAAIVVPVIIASLLAILLGVFLCLRRRRQPTVGREQIQRFSKDLSWGEPTTEAPFYSPNMVEGGQYGEVVSAGSRTYAASTVASELPPSYEDILSRFSSAHRASIASGLSRSLSTSTGGAGTLRPGYTSTFQRTERQLQLLADIQAEIDVQAEQAGVEGRAVPTERIAQLIGLMNSPWALEQTDEVPSVVLATRYPDEKY